MTTKNVMMTTTFSLVAILAIGTIAEFNSAFAEEESTTRYKMADDIEAILTFTFRDGVEVHNFPVFNMGEDFVDNSGISFQVEGILNEAPHLHEALDQAYQYRLQTSGGSSFEYDYRYFEVDVDFVKHGEVIKTLNYHDCDVSDYEVKTLRDDQESYMSSKTGFAIVDHIDFNCGGLDGIGIDVSPVRVSERTYTDYGTLDYKFANDVRTFVTFEFDEGIERIEFPFFEITSGFSEDADNVAAQFEVESVVADYQLLYEAIDKSRQVSGLTLAFNNDFDAFVEFTKDDQTLRALDYRDCIVDTAQITTWQDKEDGYTGKSGFAMVNQIGFTCAGLTPVNDNLESLYGDVPIWKTNYVSNVLPTHEFPTTGNVHAVATFTYEEGQEVIDFPFYDQGDVLAKSSPTFTLEGIVDDTPLLYNVIDENLSIQSQTGTNPVLQLFQVDIDLIADGKHIRSFNYVDCRVTDYVVESDRDKEDGYFKGFALANIIDFECTGYHSNNPIYDTMFEVDSAKNISSADLRDTQNWDRGFYVQ
ncbi:MAG: hypothetical protein IS860_03085 [Nitrosopumilus sp.]|nr:hypothetical protein [Nitrosopumilus sp.]